MIIVRLAGGLGNQIFQLGAALLLAEKSNIKHIVIDDYALHNYEAKRKNELLNFFDFNKNDIEIKFRYNFITKLRLPKFIVNKYFISDKNFKIVISNPSSRFMLLDGYFQECLTQKDFNIELKLLKRIFIQNNFKEKDGCIIHIRGGDFVKLGWNSVTSKEYYKNAIQMMKNNYNQNNFYIVSDDKDYSETILKDLNIKYEFIGNSMYEDFYIIGNFKYRILSSSTFSIWASALGNNDNSIVIAPKEWIPNHKRKIYLPNEIRI
jgi:hypothetical protein